jgi:hypothetical protein
LLQKQIETDTNRIVVELINTTNTLLTKELSSCFFIVQRSVKVMESNITRMRNHHRKFERIEGIRLFFFMLCCLSSPIIAIIYMLEFLNITNIL